MPPRTAAASPLPGGSDDGVSVSSAMPCCQAGCLRLELSCAHPKKSHGLRRPARRGDSLSGGAAKREDSVSTADSNALRPET